MRLLKLDDNGEPNLTKNSHNNLPPYAILSHTWGDEEEEVTFQEISEGIGKSKIGYSKIKSCGLQAAQYGLQYFWIDTCCIDKTNNTELSEAINSMFKWYQEAGVCYVYLSDVESLADFNSSRWFKRGWTLQELLGPKHLVFFNKHWIRLDTRTNLSPSISRITGIPRRILLLDFSVEFSVAQVMSWASMRETTREEDLAYCLLGLLGVNMPLLYGEGRRAFVRLQQEFMKSSTDHSLFAWRGHGTERGPYAESPTEFQHCQHITAGKGDSLDFAETNRGLRICLPLIELTASHFAAVLDCKTLEGFRIAIYLKRVRPGIYRRIRCNELRIQSDDDELLAPQTLYIEAAAPRTLGRDRSHKQTYPYYFLVDFEDILHNGFGLQRHHCPDDHISKFISLGLGLSSFRMDYNGQYSATYFSNTKSGEHFIVVIGIHNFRAWLDVTTVRTGETFESVVDEYYHYRKIHSDNSPSCRCKFPERSETHVTKVISSSTSVDVKVVWDGMASKYKVTILINVFG